MSRENLRLFWGMTGHARLVCSVVNAIATARCRYQPFAGYEGSIPTSEKPKKSFSCGLDRMHKCEPVFSEALVRILCILFYIINPNFTTHIPIGRNMDIVEQTSFEAGSVFFVSSDVVENPGYTETRV